MRLPFDGNAPWGPQNGPRPMAQCQIDPSKRTPVRSSDPVAPPHVIANQCFSFPDALFSSFLPHPWSKLSGGPVWRGPLPPSHCSCISGIERGHGLSVSGLDYVCITTYLYIEAAGNVTWPSRLASHAVWLDGALLVVAPFPSLLVGLAGTLYLRSSGRGQALKLGAEMGRASCSQRCRSSLSPGHVIGKGFQSELRAHSSEHG
jgi:hypothetical protein